MEVRSTNKSFNEFPGGTLLPKCSANNPDNKLLGGTPLLKCSANNPDNKLLGGATPPKGSANNSKKKLLGGMVPPRSHKNSVSSPLHYSSRVSSPLHYSSRVSGPTLLRLHKLRQRLPELRVFLADADEAAVFAEEAVLGSRLADDRWRVICAAQQNVERAVYFGPELHAFSISRSTSASFSSCALFLVSRPSSSCIVSSLCR